jgi:Leucine-rich repeat (LRR) protein
MQLEQLYLSFNEISARTVIDMVRNLKGLIFLDVFGLKLTLLEAREIYCTKHIVESLHLISSHTGFLDTLSLVVK